MPLALLGTLSLLQVTFLPGYLLLRALRISGGAIATAVLSFALSLLANFGLAALLVAVGAYRPAVVYAVFAAELACWLRLDAVRLRTRLGDSLSAARRGALSFFNDLEVNGGIRTAWLRRSFIAAALAVIAGFATASLTQTGRIFDQWDAVVSWNRWAIDWAANRFPEVTSYYPQLLPANVSLTYVFMQSSEVWMFAKAVQFLFCLMLLLAMLDMARQPGNFGLIPGLVIAYALLVALLRYRMLASGYADVPLAFFSWMPVYVLIRAKDAVRHGEAARWLVAGALMASGAALTKQIGLYVAAVYPLLAWLECRKGCDVQRAMPPRVVAGLCVLVAAIVVPWYAYKFADIRAGHDADNTPQLVHDFHEGRGLGERMAFAGRAVVETVAAPGCLALGIALTASLGERRSRRLLLLIVAPLGLVWAAGFSYDLRNLAILAPFLGMAAGTGAMRIVDWAERRFTRREKGGARPEGPGRSIFRVGWAEHSESHHKRGTSGGTRFARPTLPICPTCIRVGHAAMLVALILIASTFSIGNDVLLASQRRQQKERVGIVSLNAQLYAFAEAHSKDELIATDYLAVRWLPDLATRSVVCTCHELSAFRRTFDLPNVRYVLVRGAGEAADVRQFLARPGAVRLLFEDHGFAFYKKSSRP